MLARQSSALQSLIQLIGYLFSCNAGKIYARCFMASLLCNSNCYNATIALTNWLLGQAYSPDIIPSTSSNQPLTVYVLVAIAKLIALDNTGIFNIAGIMTISWQDPKLKWNISDFNGLRNLQIQSGNVWTPTLTLLNPASNSVNFPINTEPMWVYPDGTSIGFIDSQFVSACSMDLTYFPYDTQTCNLQFTDINYFSTLLIYQPSYPNVTLGLYNPSVEWTILNAVVSNSSATLVSGVNQTRYFATLLVSVTLQRTSFYYTIVLVFPTILLEVMLFFVFLLPHGSPLKVTLAASLVLSMYVLQKDSASMLPSFNVAKYPRIIWALCAGMVLGAVTLVCGVLSVTIAQLSIRVPHSVRRLLLLPTKSESTNYEDRDGSGTVQLKNFSYGANTNGTAEEIPAASNGTKQSRQVILLRELLMMKQEKAKEREQASLQKEEARVTAEAWRRIELIFTAIIAIAYIVDSIYYTIEYLLI